jgi:hypothetical protein
LCWLGLLLPGDQAAYARKVLVLRFQGGDSDGGPG